MHTAKNKLTKNVQEKGLDPAEFRKTYMSLKTKQLFELDPYTYFLGKVPLLSHTDFVSESEEQSN